MLSGGQGEDRVAVEHRMHRSNRASEAVAPAVPMEFIHLRLLAGHQSQLEVIEA